MAHQDSTTEDIEENPRRGLGRWSRIVGMALVTLVVLAGATGLAGPAIGTVAAEGGGYELDVVYPHIIRAGQPAPMEIRVTSPGGFDKPIQLALCDEYFDDLDFQNWYPNPSAEIGEGGMVVYQFDPPVGEVFEVDLDARVSPGQFGEVQDCHLGILRGRVEVVGVTFDSWRLP